MTDTAGDGSGAAGRSFGWLKIALIGSVALNLLVLGAVIGTMYGLRFGPPGRHSFGGRSEAYGLWAVSRAMPDDRRKEFRKQLSADRKTLRPMIDEARKARTEAAEKLAAEPFDRAALAAAIANVGEKERAFRQAAVEQLLARIDSLTPDERHALAETWRRKSELRRMRHQKDLDDKDDPPPAADDAPPPSK